MDRWVAALLALLAVVAAAALVMWAVLKKKEPDPPPTVEPAVNVRILVVRPTKKLIDDFRLPAVVEPNRVVRVAAEVAGRIEEINCREGDPCCPPDGDKAETKPLVKLNTDVLEAEFQRAEATAQLAQSNFERMSILTKQGSATAQDLDKAQSALRTSKAAERLAKVRLERAEIFAPIEGVLNDLLIEKGEFVQPGDPIAEIVDIEKVKVVTLVPELDVHFLKIGDDAGVAVTVRGRRSTLRGKVTYISSLADERTRATRVEITLDNKGRNLRSGQIVRVALVRRVLENPIMIPLIAVVPLERDKAVYVVETEEKKDEKTGKVTSRHIARRRIVTLDSRVIKKVDWEVPEGDTTRTETQQVILVTNDTLKPGDRMVVIGQQFLAPDKPIDAKVLEIQIAPDPTTKP